MELEDVRRWLRQHPVEADQIFLESGILDVLLQTYRLRNDSEARLVGSASVQQQLIGQEEKVADDNKNEEQATKRRKLNKPNNSVDTDHHDIYAGKNIKSESSLLSLEEYIVQHQLSVASTENAAYSFPTGNLNSMHTDFTGNILAELLHFSHSCSNHAISLDSICNVAVSILSGEHMPENTKCVILFVDRSAQKLMPCVNKQAANSNPMDDADFRATDLKLGVFSWLLHQTTSEILDSVPWNRHPFYEPSVDSAFDADADEVMCAKLLSTYKIDHKDNHSKDGGSNKTHEIASNIVGILACFRRTNSSVPKFTEQQRAIFQLVLNGLRSVLDRFLLLRTVQLGNGESFSSSSSSSSSYSSSSSSSSSSALVRQDVSQSKLAAKIANKETEREILLLSIANDIYGESSVMMISQKVIQHLRNVISVDQASLFYVDHERKVFVSRIFNSAGTFSPVTIPMELGILGYVARTGDLTVAQDAYQDSRFNKEVDALTGYRTRNLLCVPIVDEGQVIAVISLVNKIDSKSGLPCDFTDEDVQLANIFTKISANSMHKAMLLEKVNSKSNELDVAVEIMRYHSQATAEDVQRFCQHPLPAAAELFGLDSIDFDVQLITNEDSLVQCVVRIFVDSGIVKDFRIAEETLARFVLTVRKNYRKDVAQYHNFHHATSVTQQMYSMLQLCGVSQLLPERLDHFVLLVACLCHDIDHRGKNSAFEVKVASPLARLYTTSPLERHHFSHSVRVLTSPGHNIFENLSPTEYRRALTLLESCILATDLHNHLQQRNNLENLVYDVNNEVHRDQLRRLIMTCCDLGSMAKPFDAAKRSATIVYREFFEQAWTERQLGIDRAGAIGLPPSESDAANGNSNSADNNDEQQKLWLQVERDMPMNQVSFIESIVEPAYNYLNAIIGSGTVSKMLEYVRFNKATWKAES